MRVPFGGWEPDSAGVDVRDGNGLPIMQTATNLMPSKVGYEPLQALVEDSSTTALPANCVGLVFARKLDGSYLIFAGTATKLYKYSAGTWVDYTRVAGGNYNVPTGDFWSWAQFGSKLIACNINDNPQVIDVDSGATAFADLGGTPPKARYVAVIGDFVILACLSSNPLELQNSAINNTAGWTVGTNLSDVQIFPDGGNITGITGGEFGYIVQEHAIRRMLFQPGFDQAFRFERIEQEHGADARYSVVSNFSTVFFASRAGFFAMGASGLIPIGDHRVNQWFRDNSDAARFTSVQGFSDPFRPHILWAFYNNASSAILDRLLIYDWRLDRWSSANVNAQVWARIFTSATTLESLTTAYSTLEAVPYSLDSSVFAGGIPTLAGISPNKKIAYLQGNPLDATLTTSPMHLIPGSRANVSSVYPIGVYNDATIGIRIGKREHTKNPVVYGATIRPSSNSGIAWSKSSGRVHEFELSLTNADGNPWDHAEGLEINATQDGIK